MIPHYETCRLYLLRGIAFWPDAHRRRSCRDAELQSSSLSKPDALPGLARKLQGELAAVGSWGRRNGHFPGINHIRSERHFRGKFEFHFARLMQVKEEQIELTLPAGGWIFLVRQRTDSL